MGIHESLPCKCEIYFKLQEAEHEAEVTEVRYTSEDVLTAMLGVIRAK